VLPLGIIVASAVDVGAKLLFGLLLLMSLRGSRLYDSPEQGKR
jgi:hypothetical protein